MRCPHARGVLFVVAYVCCCLSAEAQGLQWGRQHATPGTELVVIEKGRQQTPAGPVAVYVLQATGFGADQPYSVWVWAYSSGGEAPPMQTVQVVIDAEGKLYTPDGTELELMFPVNTVLPGDSFELGLISADRTERNFALITPVPIQDKGGSCRMTAAVAAPLGTAYLLRGEGFEPGEEVKLASNSENEVQEGVLRANEKGKWTTLVLPVVQGKRKGKVRFEIAGARCKVKASGNWQALLEK